MPNYLIVTKLLKLFDMAKPPLGKVEALLYVLQHVTQKRMCQNFDTPSLFINCFLELFLQCLSIV